MAFKAYFAAVMNKFTYNNNNNNT